MFANVFDISYLPTQSLHTYIKSSNIPLSIAGVYELPQSQHNQLLFIAILI